MKESKNLDLTRGEPAGLMIRFAIPLLIGAFFTLLYNTVDSIVLGKYVSASAFAAVGATQTTLGIILLASNAITNAITILMSQAFGAKDAERLKKTCAHACGITVLCGVLFGLVFLAFSDDMLILLGTPEDILEGACQYLRVVGGLYITAMLYNVSAGLLRSIGDSRTPLLFLILCSFLNIGLDLLFTLKMNWGVLGVAWATVLSQMISAILCLLYMWIRYPMLRFGWKEIRPDRALLKSFSKIAMPMLFQNFMLSAGTLVITGVINSFGTVVVAGYSLGVRVENLVTVVLSQVAFSYAVYAGQNMGANRYDRIRLGIRRAYLILGVLTGISMLVLLLAGRPLALLFVNEEETEILEAGLEMIRIEAYFLPALTVIWLFNSCLRGMGDIMPTVVSGFVELLMKMGLAIVLSRMIGRYGIWFAAPVGWVLGLIPDFIEYYIRIPRRMRAAGKMGTERAENG